MRPIRFVSHPPTSDRHHVVTEAEVRVVLERLPGRLWERLSAVHFNDRAMGRRLLGYVRRGRDEIALCALPRGVSLGPFLVRGQSPSEFGAARGGQWPGLAVRRFLLYDVLLHELGHLQVVRERAKSNRRRFASETRAQQFADHWRRALWSRPFDHPDPVHGPPTPEERESVREGWTAANRDFQRGRFADKAKRYDEAVRLLTRAVDRFPNHATALERLGVLHYAGLGTSQSYARAIEILGKAVRLDPSLFDATLFLALALGRDNQEVEARRCFERAILLDPLSPIAMSTYADSLADWGHFAEAEALFRKATKKDEGCVLPVRDYGRCLIRDHNPEADNNLSRAVGLFERAVALDPGDAESHYRLGDALSCVDGESERAVAHLRRALRINPAHAKAARVLAEIEAV